MATDNRILTKSKSSAAGNPATSDVQVGEMAVNTYTGLTYLGTNKTNAALTAGATPTEVTITGMPVSALSLDSSNLTTSTTGAIKTYVDAAVVTGDTTLANTKIWIGDSGGDKAEFALSGDVTMTAGGDVSLVVGAVSSQTALGGAPATSDELMINDGGVLKKITVANLAASSEFAS